MRDITKSSFGLWHKDNGKFLPVVAFGNPHYFEM